ncbi:TPA: Tn3 family transposase, partial [Klebsiella oxytoca]|nr:Tn3 family transposase [Klebsiella oxytoca]
MARRQILSLSERESLLALPDDELTLIRMAYFSAQDLAFINAHRKPASRFGFAVLLCYLKNIGFAPDKKSSPPAELLRIIGVRLKLSAELWQEYISGRDTTRREHLGELYRYLELKAFNGALQKACIQHLLPLSTRTDRGILIAEELLKHLHQQRIIVPGIDVVERTCAEAMTLGDKAVYTTLNAHLGITHKSALDALLVTTEKQISRLTWLLQPPGKINGKNVLQHIDRLNAIEALALPEGVERTVHQNRLLKLAREGRKMSSRDLADFASARRYATMVCVLTEARATIIDEIIELHERILSSMFSQAKRQQAERLQKTGKLIQQKLRQYVSVGQAILDARNAGEDPLSAVERILPWEDFAASLEETRLLARKDNFEPLHLITEKFSTLRKYSSRLLSALQLRATPAALPLNDALDTIREMYRKQLRKVPSSAPLDFIPESWKKMVITPSGIDRQYYEICAMNELKGAMRAGDIWVRGSRRYKNFDDYLMPRGDFEKLLNNNKLNIPVESECGAYLKTRLTLLASRLEEVNAMAVTGDLPDVDISDKGVKITPLDNSVPPTISPLADLIYNMLPHPKITEILDEVER